MNAIRQIYHDAQESISVPESMRHQHIEVIFINLDEQTTTHIQPKQGLGTLALQLFANVDYEDDAELELPTKEYLPAMIFE